MVTTKDIGKGFEIYLNTSKSQKVVKGEILDVNAEAVRVRFTSPELYGQEGNIKKEELRTA